jgi:predicted PurR-regulated permease PerM
MSILATLLLVHLFLGLVPILMPLILGSIVAVALSPLLNWMLARRVPRWLAISLLTVGLFLVMFGTVAALVPKLVEEFYRFVENLPQIRQDLLNSISSESHLRPLLEQNLNLNIVSPKHYDVGRFYSVGSKAFGGLTEVVLVFVFSIYMIADGPRAIAWATAFFSPIQRIKIQATLAEISDIVFAYASGQFITSLFSFLYTLGCLSLLHVPGALLLATLAGIFDVLPVLGFFLAVFPAMIFALRVSVETSFIVLAIYIVYHLIENYFIVPWVYGNRLRLSGLTVLIATLAAGFLAGIEGAICILPLVASYQVIEKIWLRHYVGSEAVQRHQELDVDAHH